MGEMRFSGLCLRIQRLPKYPVTRMYLWYYLFVYLQYWHHEISSDICYGMKLSAYQHYHVFCVLVMEPDFLKN